MNTLAIKRNTTFNKVVLIDDDMTGNAFFGKMSTITNLTKDLMPIIDSIDAINYFKSMDENEKPEAIFIDIEMPIIDGWEVLESIKENNNLASSKIFMITNGNNVKDDEKAQKDSRVSLLLHKPLSLNIMKHIKDKY